MKTRKLKTLSGLTVLLSLVVQTPARAEGRPEKIDLIKDQAIDISAQFEKKAPLAFVPIPRIDPMTKVPLGPNDTITIDGKELNAKTYFDDLDNKERELNLVGLSLREAVEGAADLAKPVVTAIAVDTFKREEQKQLNTESHRSIGAVLADGSKALASFAKEQLEEQIKEELKKIKLPSLSQIYRAAMTSSLSEIKLPEIPSLPKIGREILRKLELKKSKAWDVEFGSHATAAAYGGATVTLQGNEEAVTANGTGAIGIYLFNKKVQFVGANADFRAPLKGEVTKGIVFTVIGVDTHVKHLDQPKCKESTLSEQWYTDIRFSVGPVPMLLRMGADASIDFEHQFGVQAMTITASVIPKLTAKAFVQCGVDVGFAGAGAGADLTIIEDRVVVQGKAKLSFADSVSPQLELIANVNNELLALKGRAYAYAYIDLLLGKIRYEADLLNFGGITHVGNVIDWRIKLGRKTTSVEGDLSVEDLDEKLKLLNWDELRAEVMADAGTLFSGIRQDFGSYNPALAPSTQELLGRSDAMTRMLNQYRADLIAN